MSFTDDLRRILLRQFLHSDIISQFERALYLIFGFFGKTWDKASFDATLKDVQLVDVLFVTCTVDEYLLSCIT